MQLSGCKYNFFFRICKQKEKKRQLFFLFLHLCKMNLVIDIGNTFGKMVVYSGSRVVFSTKVASASMAKTLEGLFLEYPTIGHCILCVVGHLDLEVQSFLKKHTQLVQVSAQIKLPFKNVYKTPETLGADRMALVAAAAFKFPNANCLVVDAGSCITYDFLSANGFYKGGGISPGLQMRFKAMHEHTKMLPLLQAKEIDYSLGTSTEESLLAGAINGVVYEMDGWCNSLRAQYKDLKVVLTGGDAQFLSKRLKNTIFTHSNFLAEGLRLLLDYNIV